ncbi:hypothetical protein [Sorangium sp. So ce861]|uniref:hypothetical protein n=1 Tax=Sorangium sp. So ce861 TaxID=3133323 RepID=UPI003F5F3B91
MSQFTYDPPNPATFLTNMRAALRAKGRNDLADLLEGAEGSFYTNEAFGNRWNSYVAELRLRVDAARVVKFNDVVRLQLRELAEQLLDPDVGYDLDKVVVSPFAVGDDGEPDRLPEIRAFLHTVRSVLEKEGRADVAALLQYVPASFATRWKDATLVLRVSVDRHASYESAAHHILSAGRAVLRSAGSYFLKAVEVLPLLEAPPDDSNPLPNASLVKGARTYEHDGLHFRSKTEIKIYDALKKRAVLFFANATAVLGGKSEKREPDFLVCEGGKWGILEVMGEQYHPAATAMKDHDRARLFKDYGIVVIEFYEASRCYNRPEEVVDDFLTRLRGPK